MAERKIQRTMAGNYSVLFIDRNRSVQVSAEGEVVNHCLTWFDKYSSQPNEGVVRHRCRPADKSDRYPLSEKDLFEMIGIKDWNGMNASALEFASSFTYNLVAIETGLSAPSPNWDILLDFYESAIDSRQGIAKFTPLIDSPRWKKAQEEMFFKLRKDIGEKYGVDLKDGPDFVDGVTSADKEKVERLAKLYDKSGSFLSSAEPLLRLRWRLAESNERVDLCQKQECKDSYRFKADNELKDTLLRRPTLTTTRPAYFFKEPKRNTKHYLGLGMGIGPLLEDGRYFSAVLDFWLMAQVPEVARVTIGGNASPVFHADIVKGDNGVEVGKFKNGTNFAGYFSVAPIVTGEAATIGIGGAFLAFDGTEGSAYRTEAGGQWTILSRKDDVETTFVPRFELMILPRDGVSIQIAVISSLKEKGPFILTWEVGIQHWANIF